MSAAPKLPRLVGVIHLPALPGSPGARHPLDAILSSVRRDAKALESAGFDAVILENFGDAPFHPCAVEPIVVSAMTACVRTAREACALPLGVNVLRNDAAAALAIAAASDASFIRINVHVGAVVADQGIVQGKASETLRLRRAWGAEHVAIWADVDVKHAAPLAVRDVADVTHDMISRGMVDAVLVTGRATGAKADLKTVARVAEAASKVPVYVASGAAPEGLTSIADAGARGVIVGSFLRKDGRAGGPIDARRASRFAGAFQAAFGGE